jgi:hypothetical protein
MFRRALLAGAVACAMASTATSEPPPSRDYPPAYSSRKKPWYDPFGWLTSDDKSPTPVPAKIIPGKPPPGAVLEAPPGIAGAPAWKWYGYGTPTPGGSNPDLPGTWYSTTGASPGAMRHPGHASGPLTFPMPLPDAAPPRPPAAPVMRIENPPIVAPPGGPSLPGAAKPSETFAAEVDWKSSATLGRPASDRAGSEGPRATLRPPVPADQPAKPTAPAARPRTPAEEVRPNLSAESPDIPIVPAPGIVMPPLSHANTETSSPREDSHSNAVPVVVPVTARGRAPDSVVADVIRRTSGSDVRIVEIIEVGAKRLVVRVAGPLDAALAFRNRLAQMPQLSGWRVDFDHVTPLGR